MEELKTFPLFQNNSEANIICEEGAEGNLTYMECNKNTPQEKVK